MNLRKKCINSLLANLVILIIGIVLLVFPTLVSEDINTIFYSIMYIIAAIKFCEYFMTKEPGDYEYLWVALASTLAGTSGVIFNLERTSMVLSLTLICWVAMVSVIKLIKVDYLMDRKNKMWYVEVVIFMTFLLTGILTSINLYYELTVQALMLGFFFLIIGLLETAYPLLNMMRDKLEREKEKIFLQQLALKEQKEIESKKETSKAVATRTTTAKKAVGNSKKATKKESAPKSSVGNKEIKKPVKKTTKANVTSKKETAKKAVGNSKKTTKKESASKSSVGNKEIKKPVKKTTRANVTSKKETVKKSKK